MVRRVSEVGCCRLLPCHKATAFHHFYRWNRYVTFLCEHFIAPFLGEVFRWPDVVFSTYKGRLITRKRSPTPLYAVYNFRIPEWTNICSFCCLIVVFCLLHITHSMRWAPMSIFLPAGACPGHMPRSWTISLCDVSVFSLTGIISSSKWFYLFSLSIT